MGEGVGVGAESIDAKVAKSIGGKAALTDRTGGASVTARSMLVPFITLTHYHGSRCMHHIFCWGEEVKRSDENVLPVMKKERKGKGKRTINPRMENGSANLCLTAYKMMSRPSVLAGPSDPKNPDLYYWQARAYLTAVDINYALGNILPSLLVYLGVILVLGVHFKQ